MKRSLFIILSFLFAVAALYHLVGVFIAVDSSPTWRHFLFVCVNGFIAYSLLKRPKYFIYVFAVLLLQQLYSHGGSFINLWLEQGKIDWISAGVLLLLPLIFVLLILDLRRKTLGKLYSNKSF